MNGTGEFDLVKMRDAADRLDTISEQLRVDTIWFGSALGVIQNNISGMQTLEKTVYTYSGECENFMIEMRKHISELKDYLNEKTKDLNTSTENLEHLFEDNTKAIADI